MGTKKSLKEREYITVAEYAEARGVSTTAVYKRLEKSLKRWYRVIDGKKLLLSSVLTEEEETTHTAGYKAGLENQRNVIQTIEEVETAKENAIIEELRAEIEQHKAEKARLLEEIAAQREAIKEKDAKIVEFAGRFAELANQAQQLHAAQTMIEAKSAAAAEDAPAEPETKKRGFFARLLYPD